MALRTWTNGTGLALSAANLNALEADVALKADKAANIMGSGQDLNTYVTSGFWNANTNTIATGGTNYPAGASGLLEVYARTDGTSVIQRYTTYSTSNKTVYTRSLFSAAWSVWVELANVGDTSISIAAATNLNTMTTPGNYHQATNAQATLLLNYPDVYGGTLFVEGNVTYVTQTYTVYASAGAPKAGARYTRVMYNAGTWGAWKRAADSLINVKDYGAIGDNVTDDTTAINAALVVAQGRKLTFPKGQYKVTGNLVNFWGALPVGEGSIVRGAEEYFITPTNTSTLVQTSTMWANYTTGVDTNDGLFSVSPVKTLNKIYRDMLRRLTPEQANGGYWKARLSGAFQGGLNMSALPEFAWGVTFEGDALVAGAPVTVINYDGNSSNAIGMRFEPGVRQVTVNNIKFTNFSVGFNGYGLLMKDGGVLTTNNCWADACDIGFAAIRNVSFSILDTKATNSITDGFRAQYSSSGTFDSCTSQGSGEYGFYASRNAVMHVDYCTADDNRVGMQADMAARAACIGSTFSNNTDYGVKTEGAAEWIRDDTTPNIFTGNGVPFGQFGVSRENRLYSQTPSTNEFKKYGLYNVAAHTGTLTDTALAISPSGTELPAQFFQDSGKKVRLRVWGRYTGVAGSKTITLKTTQIDGTNIQTLTTYVMASGGSNQTFIMEADVVPQTTTIVTGICRSHRNLELPTLAYINVNINATAGIRFRLYAMLGNTADSILIDGFEVYCSG